jgi:RNA polymerase sigma-70 factor (TIGR02960 family)
VWEKATVDSFVSLCSGASPNTSPTLLLDSCLYREGDVTQTTTDELLTRARAGDGAAFRELTDPFRGELHAHCYRMLGSFHDAEEALQETMLSAWQSLDRFEERASMRTWLYSIATNRCLNIRRTASRRPAQAWGQPRVTPHEPTRYGEVMWLEPYPSRLGLTSAVALEPEKSAESTESMTIAFITALQLLPARQCAVLILCDVLDFSAAEVAEMIDATVGAVNSALKRARKTLREKVTPLHRESPPAAGSAEERYLVDAFISAYQRSDIPALVAMLTDDAVISMPPVPYEYVGRNAAAGFYEAVHSFQRDYRMLSTRANGQPAVAIYALSPEEQTFRATGLIVLGLAGTFIGDVTRFDTSLFDVFGLPQSLPSAPAA